MTPAPAALPPDLVAGTVLAVPGVAGLHPGRFGEVASYLPGRRVVGVRVDGRSVEVHVVVRWGEHVLDTAEAVRRSLKALGATVVDVVVQDVVVQDVLVPADGSDRRGRAVDRISSAVLLGETP